MNYVPTACPIHGRHNLTPLQAARVLAVLPAVLEERTMEDAAPKPPVEWTYCMREWGMASLDPEGYYETTESVLGGLGVEDWWE